MLTLPRRYLSVFAAVLAMLFAMLAMPPAQAEGELTGSIWGEVTDAQGDHLTNVTVVLYRCEEGIFGTECVQLNTQTTDINGEYRFENVAQEPYRIRFVPDDNEHEPRFWPVSGTPVYQAANAAEISWGEEPTFEAHAQLSVGASIAGSVSDSDNVPVEDASVSLISAPAGIEIGERQLPESDFKVGGLIPGAYTLRFEHNGRTKELTRTVTAGQVVSGITVVLDRIRIENIDPPTVIGNAYVGQTLSVSDGSWSQPSVTFSYRWLADGIVIPGATGATFQITPAQGGKAIAVEVTARKSGYSNSEPVVTASTNSVELPEISNITEPAISGSLVVGQTLTASKGTWNPSDVTVTYQWFADGAPILDATQSTLVLTSSHVGKPIQVEVTPSKSGYQEMGSVSSAPTAVVAKGTFANTARPVISGNPYIGSTLTGSTGTWSTPGVTLYHGWLADGEPIVGETGTTLAVTSALAGKKISFIVRAEKAGYNDVEPVTSLETGPVTSGVISSTSAPVVSGFPAVAAVLSVSAGSWSEPGVSVSYQWLVNGVAITGATGSTYKVPTTVVGKSLSVRVTAAKAGFDSGQVTSAATASVGYASAMSVKAKAKKKRKVDFTVAVSSNRKAVRGRVAVYRGTTLVKAGNLSSKGKITIKTTKQPKGSVVYTVTYFGYGTAKPVSKLVRVTTKK